MTPLAIDSIFKNKQVANQLLKLEVPGHLSLKPSNVAHKMQEIAKYRYNYELPEKVHELNCFATPAKKMAFLRDICKTVGISVSGQKSYLLTNNTEELKNALKPKEETKQKGRK